MPSRPASPILAHISLGKLLDLSVAAATSSLNSRRTNSWTRSRSSWRSDWDGGSKPLGCFEVDASRFWALVWRKGTLDVEADVRRLDGMNAAADADAGPRVDSWRGS